MAKENISAKVTQELFNLLVPLSHKLSNEEFPWLMRELGWNWPEEASGNFGSLINLIDSIKDLLEGDGSFDDPSVIKEIITTARSAIDAINSIDSLLPTASEFESPIREKLEGLLPAVRDTFATKLLNYSIVRYLEQYHPAMHSLLRLIGFVGVQLHKASEDSPAFEEYKINWSNLSKALTNPGSVMRDTYHWADSEKPFNGNKFLSILRDFAIGFGIPAACVSLDITTAKSLFYPEGFDDSNVDIVDWGAYKILRVPIVELANSELGFTTGGIKITGIPRKELNDKSLRGLAIIPFLEGDLDTEFKLSKNLYLKACGELDAGFAVEVLPDGEVELRPNLFGVGGIDASLGLELRHEVPGESIVLLGDTNGTRLEYKNLFARVNFVGTEGSRDVGCEVEVEDCAIVICASEGDGFINKVLPSNSTRLNFDFVIGASVLKGLYIKGGAGLTVSIQINKQLGPIFISTVDLALNIGDSLNILTGISFGGSVGPVNVAVEQLGLKITLDTQRPGILGKADVSMGFKLPSSVGLAINTEGVKGGGYIQIDPPNYAGVLALAFQDTIDLTVFALVTTELPNRPKAFSMVLSILARFTPLQLGFGFALTGVGGLIGIHRSMDEDGLREVFMDHSLDAILFPEDPIENIPMLIDALQNVFPPIEGRHVFGLMGEIIWGGSITIVAFRFGVIVEVGGPGKIAIIGQARMALPDEEVGIIVINLDLLGFIDFGNESLAIDASLYDSRLLFLTLTGDMALRTNWRENDADFALSIGGFFPGFVPPADFPKLRRLTLRLGNTSAWVELTAYLAITCNSFQTGAKLEIYVAAGPIEVSGGAGFDALIQFSPFGFDVRFYAWVSVSFEGMNLVSIDIRLRLTGPNPFHAVGYAEISLFLFSIEVEVELTFGDKVAETPPEVSPFDVLAKELEKPRNLKFELPDWAASCVVLKESTSDDQLLDPNGNLVFAQTAVPTELFMEQYGGGVPPENERFLNVNMQGPISIPSEPVKAPFAPAQFRNWSDYEKLSAPSFEKFNCGKSWSVPFIEPNSKVSFEVKYETVVKESDAFDAIVTDDGWIVAKEIPAAVNSCGLFQSAKRRFRPGRKVPQPSHKKYVNVIEPCFSPTGQNAVNGKFLRHTNTTRDLGNMTYTEAYDLSKKSKEPLQVRDAVFVVAPEQNED